MKLKGILSCVLLGVISLSGCNTGGSVTYIKQCSKDHDHFMDTNGKDFYDLVIFEDPDSGEPDDKLTTVLLIYDEGCSECAQAHVDLNYYANTNKVDMYKYNLTEHLPSEDEELTKEEINEIRNDYNYLYRAVAWLYDGPNYSDPVIEEWPSDEDNPSVLQFTTPNVIVFDNNTGATAVLPVGTTDYLKYFDQHLVIVDESGNPIS